MRSNTGKPLTIFLLLAFTIILLRTAWIGDDSYITMRTVDNFLNGYGPTWNVGERVQSYTHPLWMFLLVIPFGISRDAYLSLISLSLFFSILTIYIFLVYGGKDDYSIFIGLTVLALSNAFIDYSTSGLENPASHLLIMSFTLLYLRWNGEYSQKRILILFALAGLITLNRMDLLLLFLPSILGIVFTRQAGIRFQALLIGFSPFILWELFSTIYYGFPFPNTYYAKLNTGIPQYALLRQGALYFFNSIAWDPITPLVIGSSLILSILGGNKQERLISLGVIVYLGYVLWIGGDFMSGRFFSAPLLSSVILLVAFLNRTTLLQKTFVLVVVASIGLMAYSPSFSAPTTRDDELENLTGVSDEQAWYYSSTGLLRWGRSTSLPNHQWVYDGRNLRDQAVKVYVGRGIGFLGFNAGANVHVIDEFALSDPLLSHLPVQSKEKFLIGHFKRSIPFGYIRTLETGENHIANPGIAQYYEKISLVTRGNIWSLERWDAIWKLNTGQYDYLLAP
jgi:arabinofuranosyltransferase